LGTPGADLFSRFLDLSLPAPGFGFLAKVAGASATDGGIGSSVETSPFIFLMKAVVSIRFGKKISRGKNTEIRAQLSRLKHQGIGLKLISLPELTNCQNAWIGNRFEFHHRLTKLSMNISSGCHNAIGISKWLKSLLYQFIHIMIQFKGCVPENSLIFLNFHWPRI
jgi:hypothetical protein